MVKPQPTRTFPSSSIAEAAIEYAARGWPVLPLKPRDKRPITKHGLLDSSTDTDQVRWWWGQWPTANVGLRTGIVFDVLDVDGPEGITSLRTVIPEGYEHPGPVSNTGKGHHLLFAVSGAPNGANMLPKLDFRGTNGYIVAPPSIHPNGHSYTWLKNETAELPEAPAWLRDLVFPRRTIQSTLPRSPMMAAAVSQLDLIGELQRLGCILRKKGNKWYTNCPFHADDTPSLVIYENDTFFCFGCNAWGDALNVRNFHITGNLR